MPPKKKAAKGKDNLKKLNLGPFKMEELSDELFLEAYKNRWPILLDVGDHITVLCHKETKCMCAHCFRLDPDQYKFTNRERPIGGSGFNQHLTRKIDAAKTKIECCDLALKHAQIRTEELSLVHESLKDKPDIVAFAAKHGVRVLPMMNNNAEGKEPDQKSPGKKRQAGAKRSKEEEQATSTPPPKKKVKTASTAALKEETTSEGNQEKKENEAEKEKTGKDRKKADDDAARAKEVAEISDNVAILLEAEKQAQKESED
ncbi:expressed unknown protein [Seminavis robusta]|uniref:Uncharacterized protein n=1 Tax=Seminavis robusta TaxID=568900 RepID=A0A9N8HNE6_9STRA|nr:expressed unknown protein [Seminavis robusta]|eukprot:Sro814_g206330.1 n/a (259) ;mRNA; r:22249-23025